MLARVFPRRTSMTPRDEYAFIGEPHLFTPDDITKVHVSVTFSWDKEEGERLAEAWSKRAPTTLGGPAFNTPCGDFTPGLFLREGCVITSRGCNNNCWFCEVPRREGKIREIPISIGNNIADSNLLQCSEEHIRAVFDMLNTQSDVKLTGGVESRLLKEWHVELFEKAKVQKIYMAYDTAQDLEPLVEAMKIIKKSEWYKWRKCGVYVLMGYPGDTIDKARERMETVIKLGGCPFAMFYLDQEGKQHKTKTWGRFQKEWVKPQIINVTRNKMLGLDKPEDNNQQLGIDTLCDI